MNEREMIARTKRFALRIMKLVALPKSVQGHTIAFVAKLGTVEEEADETAFWLELIVEGSLLTAAQIQPLLIEAGEIVAITAASRKTASASLAKSQVANRKSQIS